MSGWRRVGSMALFVTVLTALPSAAVALDKPDRSWLRTAPQPSANSHNASPSYIGRWTAAVVLIGLSGYALWRRQKSRRAPIPLNVSKIQITAFTKISPKAQLLVATVNGRSMLLGVTESNVSRLMWLENTDADSERNDRNSSRRRGEPRERASERSSPDLYPLPRTEARRAETSSAIRAVPTVAISPSTPRQKSRFREILADAIGLAPKVAAQSTVARAPVDELLEGAEDRYIGSDSHAAAKGRRRTTSGPLIDIEGQAAGLVARLNRPAS